MRNGRGAHTELSTFGLDQGENWDTEGGERIVRRNRLHILRCPTRVVAVRPESALCIELSIGPRAENQTCFWLGVAEPELRWTQNGKRRDVSARRGLGGSRKDKQKLICCDYVEDTSGGCQKGNKRSISRSYVLQIASRAFSLCLLLRGSVPSPQAT